MSDVQADGHLHQVIPGICSWRFDEAGVFLYCGDRAIPGGSECAEHYIERVRKADVAGPVTA